MMDLGIVQMNGTMTRLNAANNSTVGQLKQLISQNLNVNRPQLKLSANNGDQRHNLDDDTRTLSSYNLHSGSTVMVLIKKPIQVFVKNENDITHTYDVDAEEKVDDLQKKIFNKDGTPPNQQRLIYNGKQLEPGKMLQDYNITSGSTIYKTLCLRGGDQENNKSLM
ncbi:polyubiquitin-like [Paramisgurnus dabryanus]|uniref:polyubiquitin-like n=1 Tax=Paramisgurnus dabryanus TaxID=90735 RepID=UPI003CCF8345